MPFQPLPDNSPAKPAVPDFGLLILRVVVTATFVYYQLLTLLSEAKYYVWERDEWMLADRIADFDLPFPGIIATVFVAVVTLALAGITIGIFTRINALILFVANAVILFLPIYLSPTLTPQASLLYLGIFLALSVGGAGRISLDHRLAGRKANKNRAV